MSSTPDIITPTVTGTVGFERKVNIPVDGYGTEHATVSVYLPFEVDLDDPEATDQRLQDALARAKEQVLLELGREYEFDAEGRVMEVLRQTFGAEVKAQPAAQAAEPAGPRQSAPRQSAPRQGGGKGDVQVGSFLICRVMPDEPLPEWLEGELNALVEKGKLAEGAELWDNRRYLPNFGGDGNARSPWFKAKNGGQGVWPPR